MTFDPFWLKIPSRSGCIVTHGQGHRHPHGAHTHALPHGRTRSPLPYIDHINIQARAEEGSYIWEPRVVGLPRNGKHGLCMYNYLALGSHATVTLNESFHFLALISHLSAPNSLLSHPLPIPTTVLLKRMDWEREIKQSSYFFCTLSTPTTSPLPLVTLSLYFERFHSPPY